MRRGCRCLLQGSSGHLVCRSHDDGGQVRLLGTAIEQLRQVVTSCEALQERARTCLQTLARSKAKSSLRRMAEFLEISQVTGSCSFSLPQLYQRSTTQFQPWHSHSQQRTRWVDALLQLAFNALADVRPLHDQQRVLQVDSHLSVV